MIMTQPLRISWIVVVALALLLLPGKVAAQSAPATHNAAIPLSSRTTKNGSSSNLGVQGPNLLELFPAADITGYLNTARPVVSDARRLQLSEIYGKLPLSFEFNHGQTDRRVQFLSRGNGYSLFLAATEALLTLYQPAETREAAARRALATDAQTLPSRSAVLRMKLLHANSTPVGTALEELPGASNYFTGDDPKQWRTNIPTYGKVRFSGVYPGIDLIYYGNYRQLEYDFVVAPGSYPSAITLELVGADAMQIDRQGELVLQTRAGQVRWHK